MSPFSEMPATEKVTEVGQIAEVAEVDITEPAIAPPLSSAAILQANPWQALGQFTAARIALGRAGVGMPTSAHLAFQLAHATARDAVHIPLSSEQLQTDLQNQIVPLMACPHQASILHLHSAARDRAHYLQRPDLGRQLSHSSLQQLRDWREQTSRPRVDLAIVLADGLSAHAIARQAVPFLAELMPRLLPEQWTFAPITIVQQGRVAIGDEIAQLLGAQMVLVLIGERPGLSSPDSMGLYLTWQPQIGTTDAQRNCISNVRPDGLSFHEAAYKLHYLLHNARLKKQSGVQLKDETQNEIEKLDNRENFLLNNKTK